MAILTCLLITAVASTYIVALGRKNYGDLCQVYGLNETLDNLPEGKGRECKISDNFDYTNGTFRPREEKKRYCKTYTCPTVSCAKPVKGKDGCLRCDGHECQWGGKVYQPGEGGTCVDGCNACSCLSHNGTVIFMTTLMGCSDGYFCNKEKTE